MKVQINNKQFFFITVIYILANDITRGIFIKELVNDIWIPNLIGLAGSLLFFSLYMFIYRNNKFDNFENSIKNIVGKFISKLIFILYSIYFLIIAYFNLRDISEGIQLFLIDDVKIYVITGIILITIYYILIKGLEVFARLTTFSFLMVLFLFFLLSVVLLMINNVKFENIFPILSDGFKPIIKHAFNMTYSIPYGELFVLLIIFQFVKEKEKNVKAATYGLLIGGGILVYITLMNILVVGPGALKYGLSPSLRLSRLIDIELYIQRVDIIVVNILLLFSMIKVIVLIYASNHLIKSTFKIKKEKVVYFVICFLIFVFNIFFGINFTKLIFIRTDFIIKYVNLIFEIFIPFLLVILSFLRKNKNQTNNDEILMDFSI